MSLKKVVGDIRFYASKLGEKLDLDFDLAFCKGIRALKKYRFKLMCKFINEAPKECVIDYLDDQIKKSEDALKVLMVEEENLLRKRAKLDMHRLNLRVSCASKELLFESDSD